MLKTSEIEIWTGNQAVAEAAIKARPEVVAAYPITPSTDIIQRMSDAIEVGELQGEFIAVESEHAAMSGAIGASVAGSRTFTATAAQGLLYMAEMVYWAGYGRLPMTIVVVNRALAPGWSIWVDHQDLYSMRDAGWIQLAAKNNQEAYDMVIQSFKISENHGVYLPSMVNIDGFVLSHVASQVLPLTQKEVDDFLPPFDPLVKLDPADPVSFGALTLPNDYKLLRDDLVDSMDRSRNVIREVAAEFEDRTGRFYGDLVEFYGPSNADIGIIAMGTLAEEVEEAVDELNAIPDGLAYGAMRIRSFRPFPFEEVMKASRKYDQIIVFDRGFSFGSDPPLLTEVRNALYKTREHTPVYGRIIGIGGADVSYTEIMSVVQEIIKEDSERW